MAIDLSIFMGPLEAEGEPGLSPIDTRLNAITDLTEQRKFAEAAVLAGRLLDERIYDIRPISIYLFGALLEGGFSALGGIFAALGSLLGPNLAAVGPMKRREEQFNRRMIWLFDTSLDTLKYHQVKRTDEWTRWVQGSNLEAVTAAQKTAAALVGQLSAETYKGAHTALSRVIDWLRDQAASQRASVAEPPPASVAAPAPASPPSVRPALVSLATPRPPEPLEPVRRRVELEVSHQFIELWVKLRAFEALIEKKQFERAALVGDDIMNTIDKFDPRDYFPELFSRFSALMSKNIGTLSDHAGNRDSDSWKAMNQFYRVDLKGFVDG